MKTFVIAYMNFFDNNLCLEKVNALSKDEALGIALKKLNLEGFFESEEDIKSYAFDCDSLIEAIEI